MLRVRGSAISRTASVVRSACRRFRFPARRARVRRIERLGPAAFANFQAEYERLQHVLVLEMGAIHFAAPLGLFLFGRVRECRYSGHVRGKGKVDVFPLHAARSVKPRRGRILLDRSEAATSELRSRLPETAR